MGIRQLIDGIMARDADGIVAVEVPVLSPGTPEPQRTLFAPGQVYLEVRLQQMWLTRARELWREFLPFGTVVTEFIHKGRPVSVPTVLSSAELSRRFQITGAHDAVEISDVRVAGPVPYEGDEISLLVALFRAKSADWVARSLRVVEDVANAVGFVGLASAVPVADSLIRAIDSFMDSSDIELRVGAYRSWKASDDDGAMAPLHYCVMRRPRAKTSTAELAKLRVVDGRLCQIAADGVSYEPYTEHDFMLISIEAKRRRDDYRQLEFYSLWQQTKEHVIAGDLPSARRSWRRTAGAIHTDDLTRPQQEVLYNEYQRLFADLVERFAVPKASTFRNGEDVEQPWQVEDDPAALLDAAETSLS
ncbi:hypothetical protein [Catenulispora rubra]|uniref:hypothetical protein n=1 Tax=Catenulispora rubra TaxID=280293 RepID=UPI0018922D34|nr:hypothetical protein [Catenulispora rubra]